LKIKIVIQILVFTSLNLLCEGTKDHAVLLSARIDSSAAIYKIVLSWDNTDTNARYFKVTKKLKSDKAWKTLEILDKKINTFSDSEIVRGTGYEYQVIKITKDSSYYGYGYIFAGYDLELSEDRKKVLLLVDDSVDNVLRADVERYVYNLKCDGYVVTKVVVERTENFYPPAVLRTKNIIETESKSGNLKTIILLGRVAVPYSGNTDWDGHSEHRGAWPADLFYATPSNYWTDDDVYNLIAVSTRNKNIPHDGKFDESTITNTDIQLGRIDMYNLPLINTKNEIDLLRAYLAKNDKFKRSIIKVNERALLDDGFKLYGGEAMASNGWMNFASLIGQEKIDTLKFRYKLRTDDYLFSYGCNAGGYESIYDIAYTEEMDEFPVNTVFSMVVGSWNGDWDSQNNLLRGITASEPSSLCVMWAGRPYWYLHHFGMGEPIGYSAMITQNNGGLYEGTGKNGRKGAHVNLIGDPTLRMRYFPSPKDFVITQDTTIAGNRVIDLKWNGNDDLTIGYNLYYSISPDSGFIRDNSTMITKNTYQFRTSHPEELELMIRGIRYEQTNSGSYYNLSLGEILEVKKTTGFDQSISEPEIAIYPNPAISHINVSLKSDIIPTAYEISNNLGIVLSSGPTAQFVNHSGQLNIELSKEIPNLSNGLYYIKIFAGENFYLGKFLIMK
jgi:hypothetical protein